MKTRQLAEVLGASEDRKWDSLLREVSDLRENNEAWMGVCRTQSYAIDRLTRERDEARFASVGKTPDGRHLNHNGTLTDSGRQEVRDLIEVLSSVLTGHLDNTCAPCRIDLIGHDCCHTCNDVQVALESQTHE